jgi:hypothetical protein
MQHPQPRNTTPERDQARNVTILAIDNHQFLAFFFIQKVERLEANNSAAEGPCAAASPEKCHEFLMHDFSPVQISLLRLFCVIV